MSPLILHWARHVCVGSKANLFLPASSSDVSVSILLHEDVLALSIAQGQRALSMQLTRSVIRSRGVIISSTEVELQST
jgi:hypothetical protein